VYIYVLLNMLGHTLIRRFSTTKIYNLVDKRFVKHDGLTPSHDNATLYIKGFMNKDDKESYHHWYKSHKKIMEQRLNNVIHHQQLEIMGLDGDVDTINDTSVSVPREDIAYGYYWNSGNLNYIPSAPVMMSAMELYKYGKFALARIPYLFAVTTMAESIIMAYTLYNIYNKLEFDIDTYSHQLTDDIVMFFKNHHKIKVVAHSLGCKLLLKSLIDLPNDVLPSEIHLCAPAVIEGNYEKQLKYIDGKGIKVNIYYSPNDYVLGYLYYLLKGDTPIGAQGLKNKYTNIQAFDVSHHLGPIVHTSYGRNLHSFIK